MQYQVQANAKGCLSLQPPGTHCPSPLSLSTYPPSPHLHVARIDVSSTMKGTYKLMSDLHGVSYVHTEFPKAPTKLSVSCKVGAPSEG